MRCRALPEPPRLSSFSDSRTGMLGRLERRHEAEDDAGDAPTARARRTPPASRSRCSCVRGRPATVALGQQRDRPRRDQQPGGAADARQHAGSRRSAGGRSGSRLAPSAMRTAISFCRSTARASSRLATFAHAISSTSATAPVSRSSAGRMFCTSWSCARVTSTRTFLFDSRILGLELLRDRVHLDARLRRSSRRPSAARSGRMPGCQPRSSGSVAAHGPNGHVDVSRLEQLESAA